MSQGKAPTTPYAINVEAGRTYAWCACGRSQNQPYCDGTHGPTGIRPVFYRATEAATVHFCACKKTSTAPLCDGSHKG